MMEPTLQGGGQALNAARIKRIAANWRPTEVPTQLLIQSPYLKAFQREVHLGHLSVFSGPEPAGWHLSISHRTNDTPPKPGRIPTWEEVAEARYLFAPPEITLAMLLPPLSEYINLHPTAMHLWQVGGPVPQSELIAPKG